MIVTYIRSSSYNNYDYCQMQYFMTYVLGYYSDSGKKAELGTIVHKTLEVLAGLKKAAYDSLPLQKSITEHLPFLSMRNTGVNTLWISFDRANWFDVACGTSWDDRVSAKGFWYCTQVGITSFVVNGLALNLMKVDLPEPTPEELGE